MFQSFVRLAFRRKLQRTPMETHFRKSVLFHWFSAASCVLRPGGGAQQHRRKSSWGALWWKLAAALQEPLCPLRGISPVRGDFERTYIVFFILHLLKIEARGNSTQFDKRIQPEIFCRKKTGFRRNTLCISRKPGAFPAEKIGCSPQTNCVVLPQKPKGA